MPFLMKSDFFFAFAAHYCQEPSWVIPLHGIDTAGKLGLSSVLSGKRSNLLG